MRKTSLTVLILLVIVSPIFFSPLRSVIADVLLEWLWNFWKMSGLLYGTLYYFFAYGLSALFGMFLLKKYPIQKDKDERSFLLCLLLSFSALTLNTFIPDIQSLSQIFSNAHQSIYISIKYIFELIPDLHVTVLTPQVEDIPFQSGAPTLDEYKLHFISAVIIAPICEEFFSRYCILRIIQKHFGFMSGLILSSLSFALLHQVGELSTNALFLGLVLGFIYMLSGWRLWVPILAHVLNNFIVVMNETVKLVKKADLPIGFPTDTETAYQFANKAIMVIGTLSFLSTLILMAICSKKAFSFWRTRSLTKHKVM